MQLTEHSEIAYMTKTVEVDKRQMLKTITNHGIFQVGYRYALAHIEAIFFGGGGWGQSI